MSYIARKPRPRAGEEEFDWWCDQIAAQTQITVHEPDDSPQWTGLYDADGNELCRVRDRVPMGFRVK